MKQKGYMQFFDESGNHAAPYPDDYTEFGSLKEARALFEDWVEEVGRYAEPQNATAAVFLSEPEGDFCDSHPDGSFSVGPRGGITFYRCF